VRPALDAETGGADSQLKAEARRLARFRGYLEGHPRAGPETVHVDITNQCNLDCVTCWSHGKTLARPKPMSWKRQHMEAARFFRLIEELVTAGAERVVLSGGGEPFTHPDIERFVEAVKARGLRLTVITNGTLCDFERLRELAVDQLLLNLAYHPNQGPATFARLVEGAQRLRGVTKVNLVQVINGLNAHALVEMVELAARVGARSSFKVGDIPPGAERFALGPAQRHELLSRLIPEARTRAAALGVKHNLDAYQAQLAGRAMGEAPRCFAGYLYSRVSVDGAVWFCCAPIEAARLDDGDFAALWERPSYQALRARLARGEAFAACARCGKHDMNFAAERELEALLAEGVLEREHR